MQAAAQRHGCEFQVCARVGYVGEAPGPHLWPEARATRRGRNHHCNEDGGGGARRQELLRQGTGALR